MIVSPFMVPTYVPEKYWAMGNLKTCAVSGFFLYFTSCMIAAMNFLLALYFLLFRIVVKKYNANKKFIAAIMHDVKYKKKPDIAQVCKLPNAQYFSGTYVGTMKGDTNIDTDDNKSPTLNIPTKK